MKCVYEELSEQECKCFCGGDKEVWGIVQVIQEQVFVIFQKILVRWHKIVQQLMDKNEQIMKQTDLQKENKKLKRINFILIIYVVISIVIQLYNILV